jgi:transposase
MSDGDRRRALEGSGHAHSAPQKVSAAVFATPGSFFLATDKVQVKYEMLRAHTLEGVSATTAASTHGYSRAAFYLAVTAFEQAGMLGLLDERPGRRGPLKLTPAIVEFLTAAPASTSGADLAAEIVRRFGVDLHRRTVERARR